MALPTTISGVALPANSFKCKPIKSAGGAFYVVVLDSADNSIIEVHKATDPTSGWSEQDSGNKPDLADDVVAIAVDDRDDVIHIATQEDASGATEPMRVAYHAFDMSSDSWTTTDDEIATPPDAGGSNHPVVDIKTRSDGDIIVIYDSSEKLHGTDWDVVMSARNEGAGWTSDVQLSPSGVQVRHEPWCAVLGDDTNDRIHVFWYESTGTPDLHARTIRSDNSLSTQADFGETPSGVIQQAAVSYDDGGTQTIVLLWRETTSLVSYLTAADADSPSWGSGSTVSTITVKTISAQAAISNVVFDLVEDGSGNLHALMVNNSDSDLEHWDDSSGWAYIEDAVTGTINRVAANVYSRSGSDVIGYLYDDGGTIKYNEISLGGGTTTLTAESGSVPIAGTAATLLLSLVLSAASANVPITGTAANLSKSTTITADPGSVPITGTAANLLHDRVLPATAGAVPIAGTDAGLLQDHLLTAASGAVPIAGTDAGILLSTTLVVDPGAIPITGTAAGLLHDEVVSAESGSVPITGTDATLTAAAKLTAESGSVSIAGNAATLLHDRILPAASGAVPIAGTDAALTHEIPITADAGSVPIAGTAAKLLRSLLVTADAGAVPIAGTDAGILLNTRLVVDPGSLPIAGTDAGLLHDRVLPAAAGAVPVAGTDVGLLQDHLLTAASGAVPITGTAATLDVQVAPVTLPFRERFQVPTGFEEPWSGAVVVGSGCTFAGAQSVTPAGSPLGWGDGCLLLIHDTPGYEGSRSATFDSAPSRVYLSLELHFAEDNLANGDSLTIFQLIEATSAGPVFKLLFGKDATFGLKLRAEVYHGGGGEPAVTEASIAIDTVYQVGVLIDNDTAAYEYRLDNDILDSGTYAGEDVGSFRIGTQSGELSKRVVARFDQLLMDGEKWPEPNFPHRGYPTITLDGVDVSELYEPGTTSINLATGPDQTEHQFFLRDGQNILKQAAALDQGPWSVAAAVATADDAIPPYAAGTETADHLEEDDAVSQHYIEQAVTLEQRTCLLWADVTTRPTTGRAAVLRLRDSSGNGARATYNVDGDGSGGIVTSSTALGTGAQLLDVGVQNLGVSDSRTWYRVWILIRMPKGTTSAFVRVQLADGTTLSYDGDTAQDGILVGHVQLEHRSDPVFNRIVTGAANYLRPGGRQLCLYTVAFYESDGVYFGSKLLLRGYVTAPEASELAKDIVGHEVTVVDHRWDASRELQDIAVDEQDVAAAAADVIALISSGGYSVSSDTGVTVAYAQYKNARAPAILQDIANRAAMVMYAAPDQTFYIRDPDTAPLHPLDFDDDDAVGSILKDPPYTYRPNLAELANRVVVIGEDDISVVATDGSSPYPTHDAEPLLVPDVDDPTELQRIGDDYLQDLKQEMKAVSLSTNDHRVRPATRGRFTNTPKGLIQQELQIQAVVLWDNTDQFWGADVQAANTPLAHAGASGTGASAGGHGGPKDTRTHPEPSPEQKFTLIKVRGAIKTPNAAPPTPPAGEVYIHFRWVDASKIWRMYILSSTVGFKVPVRASARFRRKGGLNITEATENTEAGETLQKKNDGTELVLITTRGSGSGPWQVGDGDQMDVMKCTCDALPDKVTVKAVIKDVDTISQISYGDTVLELNVTTAKPLKIVLPGDPFVRGSSATYDDGTAIEDLKPAEAGAETTTGKDWSVMANRDADNLNESATKGFVHPSYVDVSRRPNKLRKSAGDLDANDAFDKSNDDSDAIPESSTRKFIAGTHVDASRRPIKLRRVTGGADVDADDISKKAEVKDHLGGEGDPDVGTGNVKLSSGNYLSGWQQSGQPNKMNLGQGASNTLGTTQINTEAITRVKVADRAIPGRSIVEGVIDEFQNMGSGLSDAQWDALEV